MSVFNTPEIVPLGATSLLARFGDEIDRDLSLRIGRLVDRLDALELPGLVDLIPSYTTLLALVDPDRADAAAIADRIRDVWREYSIYPLSDDPNVESIDIPVVYGGDAGPDLEDVARHTGLSPDEVISRHSDAVYTVGAIGFSPGFAFLIGLPPDLQTPRRSTPRTQVPPGSVGIAGVQTGIYSLPTPGGWSLIGRTPRVMFDPTGDVELRAGDRVRFVPVAAGDAPTFHEPGTGEEPASEVAGAIEVIEPGVQASVQDLGRPGQGRAGITPGGALDRSALIAGNRLLGNPDGAAALEWTLLPIAIRFHAPCRVVLTGADPGWSLAGSPVDAGQPVNVVAGDELRAIASGSATGARGYLCVAGGIDVPVVRGSRALDLAAQFGGGYGRALRAGDRIAVGDETDSPNVDNNARHTVPHDPSSRPFRVVRGAQVDRFDEAAWAMFLSASYRVDPQSNRMGLRLDGPAVMPRDNADVISEGVVTGAVQVTGSGQPIVLLPGRATIGGYTKIATVIEADHDRLGQLRPGATIRFEEVTLGEARAALRHWRPSVYGGLSVPREETTMPDTSDQTADEWTPEGVIRVIRELAAHDVRAFSLRVETAGLEIAIDRGGGFPVPSGRLSNSPSDATERVAFDSDAVSPDTDHVVTIDAPLLGIFYRRSSPDEPPFVDVGDTVEEGQTVGVIEVMKSYHDVTALQSGTIRRILVEDGASVEYGERLMELEPADEA